MFPLKRRRYSALLVSVAGALLAGGVGAATPSVSQRIEPSAISMGDSAQLTISESGADATPITPPVVAGLEFQAISQSQRVESVNGVDQAQSSVTYQVIPQHPGTFRIPPPQSGATPLELTVTTNGSGNAPGAGNAGSPAAAGTALPAGQTRAAADGSAFVRLRLPTHELYVGQRIPVDIQVGTRDGVVASLNGVPTLNGDAFTLEPLSAEPERSTETMNGRPYSVFTWHSALEAVKPGALSLTMETPLTVRVRHVMPQDSFFADSGFADLLDDPTLRNFFGGETEKEITVASAPAAFTVQALPAAGRPPDFSGAVGNFRVSSDVSDDKAVAGDPLTLRLHVSGSGNFDRVDAHMLQTSGHWTAYAPKAVFQPAGPAGFRGEKTFEQPVIARNSGTQTLPALDFSWFDPETGHYERAHTPPLRVAVAPSPTGAASLAQLSQPGSAQDHPAPDTGSGAPPDGWRPDHVVTGSGPASLVPLWQRPGFLVLPSLAILAFSGAFWWVARRDDARAPQNPGLAALQTQRGLIDNAVESKDSALFFRAARGALQQALAILWQVPPEAVTLEAVETRLGAQGTAAQVFRLADEAAYSNEPAQPGDLGRWRTVIDRQLTEALS